MGVEVIAQELDFAGIGIIAIQQLAHLLSPINPGPTVPVTDPSPAAIGVEKQKEGLNPLALIVVSFLLVLSGCHRHRFVDIR